MRKFLNTYLGRYFIFGLCLFALVIIVSMAEAHFRIGVDMADTTLTVSSNRFNLLVDYELIHSVELVDMPDRGEHIDGKDETAIRYGVWRNDVWGEYTVLAVPNATNCIVMHLNDGRIFVFNARSNDHTAALFAQLQEHLSK